VLLDSNLFMVYCIGAIDPARISQEKVTRQYNPADFRILDRFLGRFSRVLTTPNIMTEVSNLSGRLRLDIQAVFRRWIRDNFVQVLQEEYVPTIDAANQSSFERLGLTDAVINICAHAGNLTLTDDLDLSMVLQRQDLDCVHYTNVLRFSEIIT